MKEFNRPTKYTTQYYPANTTNKNNYSVQGLHYETTRCKAINPHNISIVFDIEKDYKYHQQLADILNLVFKKEIKKKLIVPVDNYTGVNHRFVFYTVLPSTPEKVIDNYLYEIEQK